MKGGNLSNVPAPYVYIDGESLFEKTLFSRSPRSQYISKMSKIIRTMNIAVFVDYGGKVTEGDLFKSQFPFTRVVKASIPEMVATLRSEGQCIFIGDERRDKFSAYGIAYSLDASVQQILDGVRYVKK